MQIQYIGLEFQWPPNSIVCSSFQSIMNTRMMRLLRATSHTSRLRARDRSTSSTLIGGGKGKRSRRWSRFVATSHNFARGTNGVE